MEDFPVAEAEDAAAERGEMLVPVRVLFGLPVVDVAIDFHNELAFGTPEVNDEWTDRVLATELEPADLPAAESGPQHFLRRCRPLAKRDRTFVEG